MALILATGLIKRFDSFFRELSLVFYLFLRMGDNFKVFVIFEVSVVLRFSSAVISKTQ